MPPRRARRRRAAAAAVHASAEIHAGRHQAAARTFACRRHFFFIPSSAITCASLTSSLAISCRSPSAGRNAGVKPIFWPASLKAGDWTDCLMAFCSFGDHRLRRALRHRDAAPHVECDWQAELLRGRHIRKYRIALGAHHREHAQIAALDVRRQGPPEAAPRPRCGCRGGSRSPALHRTGRE